MVEHLNYAQLVIGPAGSGKSTYCQNIQEHGATSKRNVKIINLDPAAENFFYRCDIDIRELITVDKVMEKYKYGPNGALVFCMEFIIKHINWLEERINEFGDNNYFLIDCPGQLELYSHYDLMKQIIKGLRRNGMNILSVFCLDSTFLTEQSKFVSGCTLSLATMIQLELPHITVLTKADLINDKSVLESLNDLDPRNIIDESDSLSGKKMANLTKVLIDMIENYSLIDLYPCNIKDEESLNTILYQADTILQFYENQEPRDEYYNETDKMYGDSEFKDQEDYDMHQFQ